MRKTPAIVSAIVFLMIPFLATTSKIYSAPQSKTQKAPPAPAAAPAPTPPAVAASDQPDQPASYEPTEIEHLRLQVKQKDAQLAQQQFSYAQAALEKAISEFREEGAAIAKAHGWPTDVDVDPNTLIFTAHPKPPQVPHLPKTEPAKP